MKTCFLEGKTIAYEIHGKPTKNPPLIMLNGIMMSMISWNQFIESLCKERQVVLMDFFDQGKSEKLVDQQYNHEIQVQSVLTVMDELKFELYDICGVSYGAQVGLQVAINASERIRKLVVFNCAAYTSPWLKDIGKAWEKAALTKIPDLFYHVALPYIYSNTFYSENNEWMQSRKELLLSVFTNEFMDQMIRLIRSSEGYDIRDKLSQIRCDTMVVASDADYLTPENEGYYLYEHIKKCYYTLMRQCGHASMYEKPQEFVLLLTGFLNTSNDIIIVPKK